MDRHRPSSSHELPEVNMQMPLDQSMMLFSTVQSSVSKLSWTLDLAAGKFHTMLPLSLRMQQGFLCPMKHADIPWYCLSGSPPACASGKPCLPQTPL